jgi:preprotein translocase subunit SecG
MVETILIILFILVSAFLILIILLQSSKGDGLSGAMGGGFGAQNIVGVRGAVNILQKLTRWLGIAYGGLALVISLWIGMESTPDSVIQRRAQDAAPIPAAEQVDEGIIPLEESPADTSF